MPATGFSRVWCCSVIAEDGVVSALVSCFSSSCEVEALAKSPTRPEEPTPTLHGSRFTRRPKFEPSCGMFLSYLVPFTRFIGPLVHMGQCVDSRLPRA